MTSVNPTNPNTPILSMPSLMYACLLLRLNTYGGVGVAYPSIVVYLC